MGSTAAADEYHYYTYSADGNVITQACAYHDTLSATATIGLDESISLDENGKITVGEDEGNALVMAKIGSQIVKCTVTVKQRWTGYY